MVNCTISKNYAGSGQGGLWCKTPATVNASNCIIWGNTDPEVAGDAAEIVLTYSDIEGGYAGTGNINSDPLFVSPGYRIDPGTPTNPLDDTWVDGDYHLQVGSPCINTGDPQTFGVDEVDADAEPRVMGGRVDMGMDEFTDRPFVFGDLNCDGVRNNFDIDPFVLVLLSTPPGYAEYYAAYPDCNHANGDCNDDGLVNNFDIDPFVHLLLGP